MTIFGLDLTGPAIVVGFLTGLAYGLFAAALVFMFRARRVVSFAHAEVGAFGATLLAVAVARYSVPYWVALPAAMAAGAALSALLERAIAGRLDGAPGVLATAATAVFGRALVTLSAIVTTVPIYGLLFPAPPGLPRFTVGDTEVTAAHTGMLVLVGAAALVLHRLLRHHPAGIAVRAAGSNPDAVTAAGIDTRPLATATWAAGGAVAVLVAALLLPTKGVIVPQLLGATLLLRGLVAAVVARFDRPAVAFGAGVAVGVAESAARGGSGGGFELALLLVLAVALVRQHAPLSRRHEHPGGDTGATDRLALAPLPAISAAVRAHPARWNQARVAAGVALAAVAVLPVVLSDRATFVLTSVMAFGLVAVSVSAATRLTGHLSLGHFAVAAVGAVAAHHAPNLAVGVVVAAAAGALAAGALGIAGARLGGAALAAVTLGFAVAVRYWMLGQRWAFGSALDVATPVLPGAVATGTRPHFYVALAVLAAGLAGARRLLSGPLASELDAARDDDDGARAFALDPFRARIVALAASGVLAGVAGAVWADALPFVNAGAFDVRDSLEVAEMVVIGGLGSLAGPLLGALYVKGLASDGLVALDNAGVFVAQVGALALILWRPGGLAGVLVPWRDRVLAVAARRAGIVDAFATAGPAPTTGPPPVAGPPAAARSTGARPETAWVPPGDVVLSARRLTKHHGGVLAADGVDLDVRAGETLVLAGPNGAGKTTLVDLLSGFSAPDEGTILFLGDDVTGVGPEVRARRGLVRSFEHHLLFAPVTAVDTVALALRRTAPIATTAALWPRPDDERTRRERALATLDAAGLGAVAATPVGALDRVTRRRLELVCLSALEPVVALVDEPFRGLGGADAADLGALLAALCDHGTRAVIVTSPEGAGGLRATRTIVLEAGRVR